MFENYEMCKIQINILSLFKLLFLENKWQYITLPTVSQNIAIYHIMTPVSYQYTALVLGILC